MSNQTQDKGASHTPGPWEISWFICRMDEEDVAYAKAQGNRRAKIGDELWRLPMAIGPVAIDHNHWAGYHLAIEEADARLIAAAPELLEALRPFVALLQPHNDTRPEQPVFGINDATITVSDLRHARAAIAKATGKS